MCERLRHRGMIVGIIALALFMPACARQGPGAAVERIVAVGDVHGDYGQLVRALRAAQIIDSENRWIAGKVRLVQTGDVLDRGPDSRKAMDLLMSLEVQAARAGGAVHALIGNHEAMVLAGDWRYVHPGEEKAFGGAEAFRKAMGPEGRYGRWIRSHNAIVKINDILFVHAGLRADYLDRSLAEINETVRRELREGVTTGLCWDERGPLWDRFLSLGDEEVVARELDAVLRRHGASRMVVAHTVETEGVTARAGGRLLRIDVGMSSYYGGPAACLVIENGDLYEVRHPDVKRKLNVKTPEPIPVPEPQPAASRKAA